MNSATLGNWTASRLLRVFMWTLVWVPGITFAQTAVTCASNPQIVINELNTFNSPFSELFVKGSAVAVKNQGMYLSYSKGGATPGTVTVGAGNGTANPGTGVNELDNARNTYDAPTWIRYTQSGVLIDKNSNGQIALFNSSGQVLDMVTLTTGSSCSYTSTRWTNPGSCNTCVTNVGSSVKDYFRLPDGSSTFTNSSSGNSAGAAGGSAATSNLGDTGITVPSGSNSFYDYCITSATRNCSAGTVSATVALVFQDTSGQPMCSNPFIIPRNGTAINISAGVSVLAGSGTPSSSTLTWTGSTSANTTTSSKSLTFSSVSSDGSGNFQFKVTDSALSGLSATSSALNCSTLDHFSLSTSVSSAANCETVDVTITGHDASHNPVSIPSGTVVTLTATRTAGTTTGNKGDWTTTLVNGSGTLSNGTSDDGTATVTTTAAQNSFTARFQNTWSQTAQFSASATGVTGTAPVGEKPSVVFSPAAFRFVDSAGSSLSFSPTAGSASSSFFLQAVNSTDCPGSGACTGICTSYFPPGTPTNIYLAYECVAPASCVSGQTMGITNNGTTTNIQGNASGASIAYTTASVVFNATNGSGPTNAAPMTLTYSDVGNVRLWANSTGGVPAAQSSATFRVKPASFGVSGSVSSSCGSFVYMGDTTALTPSGVKATALNSLGSATPNYVSGYATTLATATLVAQNGSGAAVTLDATVPSCSTAGWNSTGCSLGTTWSTAVNRSSSSSPSDPVLPVSFKLNVLDPNGDVAGCGSPGCVLGSLGTINAYYGRLRMGNAFGSEVSSLSVPLYAEYYDGSAWQAASFDSCTRVAVPVSGSGLTLTPSSGSLSASTATLANGAASGSVASGNGTFYQGNGRLLLAPPGSGNTGYVDISLVSPPGWLLYSGIANNTSARAVFGIYNQPGNSKKIIYRREVR